VTGSKHVQINMNDIGWGFKL